MKKTYLFLMCYALMESTGGDSNPERADEETTTDVGLTSVGTDVSINEAGPGGIEAVTNEANSAVSGGPEQKEDVTLTVDQNLLDMNKDNDLAEHANIGDEVTFSDGPQVESEEETEGPADGAYAE